jgi:streptogramin lyase
VTDTIAGVQIDALRSIHPRIAFGEGGLWVMDAIAVTHVDVETGTVEPPIPLPHAGIAGFVPVVVAGFGDVLMTDLGDAAGMGAITRIDPATEEIGETVSFRATGGATGLALGRSRIWESFADGTLIEIEPRTLRETARLDLGGSLDALGVGRAGVWVGDNLAGTMRMIDPRTGQAGAPIEMSGSVNGIAVSGETAWVLDRGAGTVTPVDLDSGPGQPVRVGEDPSDISSGLGAIWVTDSSGSLWRVDPTTGTASEIPIASPLEALAIDAEGQDLVWVLVSDVSQRGT